MRFLGLGLADTVPDANTIWPFRETLTRACIEGKPAIEVVFDRFNATLAAVGFLAMSGQIADSDDVGRAFRLMSATHFDQSRPAVPIDVGFEAHAGCLFEDHYRPRANRPAAA